MSETFVLTQDFNMYQNNDDVTTMDSNSLMYGSKNVLVVGDKTKVIETRNGYTLDDVKGTSNTPIRSKYNDYINVAGKKLWIREYGPGPQSHVEVRYNNKWYVLSNSLSASHESYFTESQSDFNGVNNLIWVNGTNAINYWTGAISSTSSVTASTIVFDDNIQTALPISGSIVMNGTTYTYSSITGNTLNGVLPNPTIGYSTGDVIIHQPSITPFQLLGAATTTPQLDVCWSLNNHVFYGNYINKTYWVSASRNSHSDYYISSINTSYDNLVITGTYNGLIKKKVCFEVVSVTQHDKQSNITVSGPALSYIGNYNIPTRGKFKTVVTAITPGVSMTVDYYFQPDYTLPFLGSPSGTLTFGVSDIGSSFDLGGTGVRLFVQALIGSVTPQDIYLLEVGGADQYKYEVRDENNNIITTGGPIPMNNSTSIDGLSFAWNDFENHKIGDKWCYNLYPAVTTWFADIYTDDPRKATQGFVGIIDSPMVGMISHEGFMYINSRNGTWTTIGFGNVDSNGYQSINVNKYLAEYSKKLLRQSLMCHASNDILYVTIDNTIESLGRIAMIDTPQSKPISNSIKIDMKNSNFTPYSDGTLCGSLDFADNKLFVSVPLDNTIYIYDFLQGGWQPPQTYPVTSVQVIDTQVTGHSSFNNETYVLFNGSNDNGLPFESIAVFPYNNYGNRFDKKSASKIFIEGYKNNQSNMISDFWIEYGGCKGKVNKRIDPILCTIQDRASLGKSHLGYHSIGNDSSFFVDKFRHTVCMDMQCFYESSIIIKQSSIDGYFRIIAVGLNARVGECANTTLCKLRNSPEPVQYEGIPGTEGYSNYINPGSSHLYGPNTGGPVTP